MKGAPARRVVQFGELVVRDVVRIGQVRREAFLGLQHPQKFVTDGVGAGLDRVQPWEFSAREERSRQQSRVVVPHRLRVVATLAPDHDIDRFTETPQVFTRVPPILLGQEIVEKTTKASLIIVEILKCVLDGAAHAWFQLGQRRGNLSDRSVYRCRLVGLALALQQIRAQDERHHM